VSSTKSRHLKIGDDKWRKMKAAIAGKGANVSAAFEAYMDLYMKYGEKHPEKIGPLFNKALEKLAENGPEYRVNVDELK
jgi:hypothetical protein